MIESLSIVVDRQAFNLFFNTLRTVYFFELVEFPYNLLYRIIIVFGGATPRFNINT